MAKSVSPLFNFRVKTPPEGVPAWRRAMTQSYAVYNVTSQTSADGGHTLLAKYLSHSTYSTYNPYTGGHYITNSLRGWNCACVADGMGTHGEFLVGLNGHAAPHTTIVHSFDVGSGKWNFPLFGPDHFTATPGNVVPPQGVEIFYDPKNLNGFPALSADPTAPFSGNWHQAFGAGENGRGWSYVGWDTSRTGSKLNYAEYRPNVPAAFRYGCLEWVPRDALAPGTAESGGEVVVMPSPFGHIFSGLGCTHAHRIGCSTRSWLPRSTNSDRDINASGGSPFGYGRLAAYSAKHKKVFQVAGDSDVIYAYDPATTRLSRRELLENDLRAYIIVSNAVVVTNGLKNNHLLIALGRGRNPPNNSRFGFIIVDLDQLEAGASAPIWFIIPRVAPEAFGANSRKLLDTTLPLRVSPTGYLQASYLLWTESRARKRLLIYQHNYDLVTERWTQTTDPFEGNPVTPAADQLIEIEVPDGSPGAWKSQPWTCAARQLSLGTGCKGLVGDQPALPDWYGRVRWANTADCILIVTGAATPIQAVTLD